MKKVHVTDLASGPLERQAMNAEIGATSSHCDIHCARRRDGNLEWTKVARTVALTAA
jgi:hypothetical protein